MSAAYITHTASELPGSPVANADIERYLGVLHADRSRLRDKVLRNNGIRARHYAVDPETGRPTHDNVGLHAAAIRRLLDRAGLAVDEVDLLACGTAVPEFITPGVASAVHGALGGRPIELCSAAGVCTAGISALKYAWMAVAMGDARCAVASAAERASAYLRASHFRSELDLRVDEEDPHIALHAEFLRWMLSDGAGSALIRPAPRPDGISLRIEWVQLVSFAHALPTCMYMGAERAEDGSLTSYRDAPDLGHAVQNGWFNLRQDTRLLREHIVDVTVGRCLDRIEADRGLRPDQVDWVLPHWSSDLFREPAREAFADRGYAFPPDRVRSNLATRGNLGSASIFVMLDDLLASGDLEDGDGVLMVCPESGRFNTGYALLRAVTGAPRG